MTAPAQLEVFAPITKRERDPKTGHLYVYGKITGSDLDHDQQRMDPAWLKTAVPDWFRIGNLREQHDAKRAIGKAIELEEKDDGWYIGAKVVDEKAAEKVEEEVLTGFSIGIKNYRLDLTNKADAPNGTVIAGRICETSLVDSPCLGSARIVDHWRLPLAKADGTGDLHPVEDPELLSPNETEKADGADTYGLPAELYERLATPVKEALAELAASGATVTAEAAKADAPDDVPVVVNVSVQAPETEKADLSAAGRRKAAASGAAMPDGSYPIQTKADLRKAIRAVGRGNADHSDIRKHIIKRAKALGLEAMVPENWQADGSLKDANKADVDEELVAKAEQVLRDVRALASSLTKADDGEDSSGGEDESEDIAGADQAIAVIAKLIIAEAESLAQGNLNEACDIDLLLSAVRSLQWFKQREEAEQQGDSDADMSLADKPTQKTSASAGSDGGEDEEDEDEEDDAAASKSETPTLTKADVTELVKAAVAEATTASEERAKALEADLAKANAAIDELKALPQPGGPVLTRTTLQEAEARKSDATLLRAQANEFLAKADACSDRYLADGYREKAHELMAKADA